MGKIKDLLGQRFGRLLVIEDTNKKDKYRNEIWKRQCDCGNIVFKSSALLRSKHCNSCGCLQRELSAKRLSKRMKTHGYGTKDRLHRIWTSIHTRCYNKNDKTYKNYGGRGIKVCKEWQNDFMSFRNWSIANGYQENLTIDRIDVNGNYEPNNCRWITSFEQQSNKRNNCNIIYNNKKYTLAQLCRKLKIDRSKMEYRLQLGWTIEEILNYYKPFGGK